MRHLGAWAFSYKNSPLGILSTLIQGLRNCSGFGRAKANNWQSVQVLDDIEGIAINGDKCIVKIGERVSRQKYRHPIDAIAREASHARCLFCCERHRAKGCRRKRLTCCKPHTKYRDTVGSDFCWRVASIYIKRCKSDFCSRIVTMLLKRYGCNGA